MDTIQLEKKNFRVDSTGWKQSKNKQGIVYLESPLEISGISEFVDGVDERLIGQQLFSFPASMREIKRAGKRTPSAEEWFNLNINKVNLLVNTEEWFSLFPLSINKNGKKIKQFFIGCRSHNNVFSNTTQTFWTSTQCNLDNAWVHCMYPFCETTFNITICRTWMNKKLGFFVRCLKD